RGRGAEQVSRGNLLADSLPQGHNRLHPFLTTPALEWSSMPHAHADRNLLFGILALQMDFISRDTLVEGMNAWVLDKEKPLGRVLVGQQALGEDEHALLEALVQKHLQRHGNDPRKSLAAVSSLASAREDLEQVGDPDVQASLAHVPATRGPGEDSPPTRPPSQEPASNGDPH